MVSASRQYGQTAICQRKFDFLAAAPVGFPQSDGDFEGLASVFAWTERFSALVEVFDEPLDRRLLRTPRSLGIGKLSTHGLSGGRQATPHLKVGVLVARADPAITTDEVDVQPAARIEETSHTVFVVYHPRPGQIVVACCDLVAVHVPEDPLRGRARKQTEQSESVTMSAGKPPAIVTNH